MVTLVKDEFHLARQRSVFFIILKNHFFKVYFHFDIRIESDSFHRNTFKVTAQEFHMSSIQQFSFECIANTLFLHNMNIERLHQQTDFSPYFKMMVILHQEFISAAQHRHFIMHSFKNRSLYHSY